VIGGFTLHGEICEIAILISHFDPEAVGTSTGFTAILHIDQELVVADRLRPTGFQVGGLATEEQIEYMGFGNYVSTLACLYVERAFPSGRALSR
jgi:hypothetical protein